MPSYEYTNGRIPAMTPEITSRGLLLTAVDQVDSKNISSASSKNEKNSEYKWQIAWINVIAFIYLHLSLFYGLYLLLIGHMRLITFAFQYTYGMIAGFGITAGAHRLWAHKAYKAKWPLRFMLMIFQTIAFQNHIYEWVRDHRVHHKFTDTDADPHNAQRGFFFSHMGWLMIKKHPDVKKKGAAVDMSDLMKDPIVVWQRRLYFILMPLLTFVFPTWVAVRFLNEDIWSAWYSTLLRYTIGLNATWLVNSAAHIWGNKPYDATISPSENKYVSLAAVGEGWHNYHHVFPWDYKAAELGNYKGNPTTAFIDFFAKIGWAYNLRSVSPEVVKQRALRTGDGTLLPPDHPNHHMNNVWGWDDPDLPESERKLSYQLNPRED